MIDNVNIAFRILNFLVLLVLIYYGSKKYLVPSFLEQMEKYGLYLNGLYNDCSSLKSDSRLIIKKMHAQDEHFLMMQKRFSTWKNACNNKIELDKLDRKEIDNNIQKRFVMRSEYVKNDTAMQKELPIILDVVSKKLQIKYHAIDVQKRYINELIDVMKEQL